MGMEYFPPKQGDLASVVASLIKRLADRPNVTQSRHPGEVAVAKLTFVKFVNGVWGTGNSEFRIQNRVWGMLHKIFPIERRYT